ncbi:MarR family transcriptional regulator [Actinomadura madurae]|uniref:MarR family transcriptional regulator n=1 Tax=Actinomadura madurae TaxID=1993 RepID=UPI0020D2179D|nr:MarR family transcriptional regulator [Actinomadura madurae]MCP9969970.1 MarR family transcriptional regulator [Actinomadura madurae]
MATETPATGRPAEPDAPRDGNPPDPDLSDIATALFRLRRVWAKPDLVKRIRAQTSACADGRPLQLSNLMVVNAVAALGAGAHADAEQPGEPPAEITVGAVAERLEIDPSTASRLVGHAIDARPGVAAPVPHGRAPRQPRADRGRAARQAGLRPVPPRLPRRAHGGLAAQDRAEFARLLTRFADAAVRAPMYPDGVDRIFQEAGAE